jgi:hypothetical protein
VHTLSRKGRYRWGVLRNLSAHLMPGPFRGLLGSHPATVAGSGPLLWAHRVASATPWRNAPEGCRGRGNRSRQKAHVVAILLAVSFEFGRGQVLFESLAIQNSDHASLVVDQLFLLQGSCHHCYCGPRTVEHVGEKVMRHPEGFDIRSVRADQEPARQSLFIFIGSTPMGSVWLLWK